jgi:hypothetical protein
MVPHGIRGTQFVDTILDIQDEFRDPLAEHPLSAGNIDKPGVLSLLFDIVLYHYLGGNDNYDDGSDEY